MEGQPEIRGGCLCGAVRFRIEPPVKWCAHCHCSMCRRAHGAPVVTWTGVATERFRLEAGDEVLVRHHSSPEATRSFCGQCGSSIFFESTRWPGEIHVTVANLDEGHGLAPQGDAFFDDRAAWFTVSPAVPLHGGGTRE